MYHQKVKKLIWDFFREFARFEYALKQTDDFCKPTGKEKRIEADWLSFADSLELNILDTLISKHPKLKILLNEPPTIEVKRTKKKEWVALSFKKDTSEMKKLILSMKQVRNNLFHGGKFSNGFPDGGSRNEQLVLASLVALRFLKTQDSNVSKIYDSY